MELIFYLPCHADSGFEFGSSNEYVMLRSYLYAEIIDLFSMSLQCIYKNIKFNDVGPRAALFQQIGPLKFRLKGFFTVFTQPPAFKDGKIAGIPSKKVFLWTCFSTFDLTLQQLTSALLTITLISAHSCLLFQYKTCYDASRDDR